MNQDQHLVDATKAEVQFVHGMITVDELVSRLNGFRKAFGYQPWSHREVDGMIPKMRQHWEGIDVKSMLAEADRRIRTCATTQ